MPHPLFPAHEEMEKNSSEERLSEDGAAPLPAIAPRRSPLEVIRRAGQVPFLRLLLYYVVLLAVAVLLISLVPAVQRAFVSPVAIPALSEGAALLSGRAPPASWDPAQTTLGGIADRALTTLLVILGALALVLPVAWVYMLTKRLRYDPALVRSVIILPIVVAGIAVVVKNSLALAFSLAGIVAAVRFRNTLKDPRDAVYIFLTIAIGLSAGVQALDVALVMSMVFNFVVLALAQYNVGSVYGGEYGRTGVLSVGDASLLVAHAPRTRHQLRQRLRKEAGKLGTDGILLVHTHDPELARDTVQDALREMAKDWRLAEVVPRGAGLSTLEYLLKLKKKTSSTDLVAGLGDRWSSQVSAAEFIPFHPPDKKRMPRRKDGEGDADE